MSMPGVQEIMPPDLGEHANRPPDIRGCLEFQISDLGQRVDVPDLIENIYHDIVQKVDEKDVVGVQVFPQRWPRKVQLFCAHQTAKECLMIRGLDIYGRHIDLNEIGQGIIKVVIQDAPMNMPNDVLKDWIAQFGCVTEFRNEHLTVRGRKTFWRTGNRIAFVKSLKQPIPPMAKIKHENREIAVSVWHYGQSHMRCWFCHETVPKGHECDKAPRKRCYDCGSDSHTKANCTQGKSCFKCGSKTHIARDCRPQIESRSEFPDLGTSSRAHVAGSDVSQTTETVETVDTVDAPAGGGEEGNVSETGGNAQKEEEPKKDDSILIDQDGEEDMHSHRMEVLLIGGSNCRDMALEGDDQITMNTTPLIQGGLKISEAVEKLEELNEEKKQSFEAIIINVGACDFPVEEETDVEVCYMTYVETINTIVHACPNANIFMSSVLPRAGDNRTRVNSQIASFNKKIEHLAEEDAPIHFCNNSVHFEVDEGVISSLYKDAETFGNYVSTKGKQRLSSSITAVIKEVYFSEKLLAAAALSI